ncbi:MAG: hypothetical protein ACTHJT_09150 [Cytophaga sp.]|uniref:hypothetical protein n=1 Tax=Cytophaga sp. TaxID=29535 RepID=UPI003F7DF902
MTEEELQTYAQDAGNGLLQKDSVQGLVIEVMNRPTGLLVAQELRNEPTLTDSLVKSVKDQYARNLYFNLTLSVKDQDPMLHSGSMSRFSSMLQTMAFQMDKFVFLTTSNKDTIPVGDFVYPRLYGMGRGSTVMFAFAGEELEKEKEWVEFHLLEFGMGSGNRKYHFDMKDLRDAPDLKINLPDTK